MRARGFTLIELIIVVAIIAIIAAVALPNLMRSRVGACESSALGSLKSISVGQLSFKNAHAVDLNKDGVGEFGFLEELSGQGALRVDNAGGTGTMFVRSSPFIPAQLGIVTAQHEGTKSGYLFVVYLPVDGTTGTKNYPGAVDVGLALEQFVAYCHPVHAGRTGVRVFAVDSTGNIFQFSNRSKTFDGPGSAPAWDAMLGDNDGTGGVTWNDGPDFGGPGQTGLANEAWTSAGG